MLSDRFNRPSGPYFLSHSIGLLPEDARPALDQSYFEPWSSADGGVWDKWLSAVEDFRRALAPVLGARPQDICPQTNISSALTKVLFALPASLDRKKIILCEEDFPTVGFVFAAAAKRLGLELLFLKGGGELADPEAWSPAYRDDVHLVHVTHVFSNLGLKTPVAEIVRRARANGVLTIVDAAQSAGAIEVAADDWDADFLTGTSVKYLCGGPGAAFLWVNPKIAPRTTPVDVGWFSHESPFEFDIRRFAYADRALRFWGGTPSIAPYAIAKVGAALLAKTGVPAIAEHNQRLIDRILAALPPEAIVSHTRRGERGCSFLVRPRASGAARAALKADNIVHDERQGALRFSVHLYTSDVDADRLVAALAPHL